MTSSRSYFQRIFVAAGALALLATPALAYASLATENGPYFQVSVLTAGLALVCGLSARGRGATLALVVPSLLYLAVVTDLL